MAETVALVSVAATAAVAIAVPLIAGRLEQARLDRQLRHGSLDELRSVMDSAALALATTELAFKEAEEAVERSQSSESTSVDARASEEALGAAATALRGVWEHRYRTAVRLGDDASLPTIYARALDALRDELSVLQSAADGGPSSDQAESWGEVVRSLEGARLRYREQQAAFLREASQLVGPNRV